MFKLTIQPSTVPVTILANGVGGTAKAVVHFKTLTRAEAATKLAVLSSTEDRGEDLTSLITQEIYAIEALPVTTKDGDVFLQTLDKTVVSYYPLTDCIALLLQSSAYCRALVKGYVSILNDVPTEEALLKN